METLETGASTAEAHTGDSAPDSTDENATSGTSSAGSQEDADLQKQLADKDRHIQKLESELRDERTGKKAPKKREGTEDTDDVMTWMTLNADSLKLCGKEFKEELAFYKNHGIPVSDEIRDRALRDAKARKGVGPKVNVEADRQASTSTPVSGEMRKTGPTDDIPERVKKFRPDLTPEKYREYKKDFAAVGKA